MEYSVGGRPKGGRFPVAQEIQPIFLYLEGVKAGIDPQHHFFMGHAEQHPFGREGDFPINGQVFYGNAAAIQKGQGLELPLALQNSAVKIQCQLLPAVYNKGNSFCSVKLVLDSTKGISRQSLARIGKSLGSRTIQALFLWDWMAAFNSWKDVVETGIW